jgi:hypothetical protein
VVGEWVAGVPHYALADLATVSSQSMVAGGPAQASTSILKGTYAPPKVG